MPKKVSLTRKRIAEIRTAIKRRVEAGLPEDEHDYTADWVYDEAIREAWLTGIEDFVASMWPTPRRESPKAKGEHP